MGTLTTALDRVGYLTKRPPIWAGIAALMAVSGGQRGQRAALRGVVGYAIAGGVANFLLKPIVQRQRPLRARKKMIGPFTSSFPSGHTATDLAFIFCVAQELPALFIPLAAGTATAHWSIVRTGSHYASDVLAGGCVGIAVAQAMQRAWPPDRQRTGDHRRAGWLARAPLSPGWSGQG